MCALERLIGDRDEGEVEERGAYASGEREQRVLRARQTAAFTLSHHLTAGQGLHHPTDHQLPEDEDCVP